MGLIFTTDSHILLGSTFKSNLPNGPTFIFHGHSHSFYGAFKEGLPQGVGVLRVGRVVIFSKYNFGHVEGKVLVIYEEFNLAFIL